MRDDELLDIKQAAAFLKVSEASLRRWTNAGSLACLRVGRRRERRFRRGDLLAFAEHQPGAGSDETSDDTAAAGHLVGAYRSDGGRAHLATAFLAEGLRSGRACFLVGASPIHDEVTRQLRSSRTAIRERRLVLTQYAQTGEQQLDDFKTRFDAALRSGAAGLCVVGDVFAFTKSLSVDALLDYEARYDARIARRYPVVTLCLYDVRGFGAPDLLRALGAHPDTFRYPTDRVFA